MYFIMLNPSKSHLNDDASVQATGGLPYHATFWPMVILKVDRCSC